MTTFTRHLDETFLNADAIAAFPWFAELLENWQPAGPANVVASTENIPPLRLAIRNGYVNFYCGGQSVARVDFGKTKLSATVHAKYLACNQSPEIKASLGQSYVRISAPESMLSKYGSVGEWMPNTYEHQGKEKKFVEQVVAANANIIDLEMGLPSFPGKDGTLVAPRMDIVALEPSDTGWRIVFWEAKLVTNAEARAAGDAPPKVIDQRDNYHKWLDIKGNKEAVIAAYRQTCRLLVNLHDIAEKAGKMIAPLGEGIRAVAGKPEIPLSVDANVRLLIDNITEPNEVFRNNKHLQKLTKLGLHVQMVDGKADLVLKAVEARS